MILPVRTVKVYTLTCHQEPHKVQVGSTIANPRQRYLNHRSDFKTKPVRFGYHDLAVKYGFDSFSLKVIKTYQVVADQFDLKVAVQYEQLWINRYRKDPAYVVLNKNNPSTLYEMSCVHIYRVKTGLRWYRKDGKDFNTHNAIQIALNLENKTDEKKVECKQKKKTDTDARFAIKVVCECGGRTDMVHIRAHERTKTHLKWVENNTAE